MIIQSILNIDLNAADITHILNAVEIIYGDIRYATISEIGIVAGYDDVKNTTLGGVSITYTDVDTAQVMNFIGTELPLQHSPSSASLKYGLSNSMPMPPVNIV